MFTSKIDTCQNNPEKSYTEKKPKHKPSGYSRVTDKNNEKEFKLFYKVRDHCHYTGKFRGAAHNVCNLCYKITKEIPVVFHNG